MPGSVLYRSVGLVSSSSGDGVKAAVIDTDGRDDIRPLGGITLNYDKQLRWRILESTQNDLPTTEILRLEKLLTDHHHRAFRALAEAYPDEVKDAKLVGFHGHTIRHLPREGLTYLIGNPWQLSEAIGLPVVSDFRRHDMAIGGEGAPLVAMFHWALMAAEPRPALMLNLGTVASITWLSKQNEIIAGDTGPGVGLLNEWTEEMAGFPHDLDGRLALGGNVNDVVVEEALSAPFFARPLPKASGLHEFDHIDVANLSAADGAATLCAITVEAFARAVKKLPDVPGLLWVTGSGSEHPLMQCLLAGHFATVKNVRERGLNPHWMAAECFAWLAVRHVRRLPITTPETTNCRTADCAGAITRPLD